MGRTSNGTKNSKLESRWRSNPFFDDCHWFEYPRSNISRCVHLWINSNNLQPTPIRVQMTSFWPLDFDRTRFGKQMEGMTLVMGKTGGFDNKFFGTWKIIWYFMKFDSRVLLFVSIFLYLFFKTSGMYSFDVGKFEPDRFDHVTDTEHMFR